MIFHLIPGVTGPIRPADRGESSSARRKCPIFYVPVDARSIRVRLWVAAWVRGQKEQVCFLVGSNRCAKPYVSKRQSNFFDGSTGRNLWSFR